MRTPQQTTTTTTFSIDPLASDPPTKNTMEPCNILATCMTNTGSSILELSKHNKVLLIFVETLQHPFLHEQLAEIIPTLPLLHTVACCVYWRDTSYTEIPHLLHCKLPLVICDMFGLQKLRRKSSSMIFSLDEETSAQRMPAMMLIYQGQVINECFFEQATDKVNLTRFVIEHDDEIQIQPPQQLVQQPIAAPNALPQKKQSLLSALLCCFTGTSKQDNDKPIAYKAVQQQPSPNAPSTPKSSPAPSASPMLRRKSITLDVLVHDKTMRKQMLAFSANEHSSENILFIEEVIKYQQIKSTIMRKQKALEIVHTFLKPQGVMPINTNTAQVDAILIHLEQQGPTLDLFQKTVDDMLLCTVSDVFWRFKSSGAYKKMQRLSKKLT